jgi:hypothetical protein
MLIGIHGKKYCGKDTVSDYICNKYEYTKYSFATPIKDVCKILFGFSEEQINGTKKEEIDEIWNITPRDAMQKIGTEFGQYQIHEMLPELKCDKRLFWVKHFENNYNKDKNIIIADLRFKHEYNTIKQLGGIVIKVKRDSNYNDEHVSENELNNEKFDYIIDNNKSKEELYNKINNIIINI